MTLDDAVRTPVLFKIIRFFHENQASIDTPRGVSTWIGEERALAKQALEDLVKLKVLVAHRATSTTGYSYTNDAKLIARIGNLLKKSSAK